MLQHTLEALAALQQLALKTFLVKKTWKDGFWQQVHDQRTRGVGLGAGRVAGLDDLVDLLDVVAGALEGFRHDAAILHNEVAQHLPNSQQALER